MVCTEAGPSRNRICTNYLWRISRSTLVRSFFGLLVSLPKAFRLSVAQPQPLSGFHQHPGPAFHLPKHGCTQQRSCSLIAVLPNPEPLFKAPLWGHFY